MFKESTLQKNEAQTGQDVERASERPVYVPRADIYEHADRYEVIADMPGVDENSVDITIEKKVLTLSGRVTVPTAEGWTLRHAEYGIGDYFRSFQLTDEVDENRIQARVKNGELRLTLPKIEPVRRRIDVKSAG